MSDNETRVTYKAIANFASLSRAVRKARKDIADLRREEALLNSQSVAGSTAASVATAKHEKTRSSLVDTFEKEAGSVQKSTVRFIENAKAVKAGSGAIDEHSAVVNKMTGEIADADVVSEKLNNRIKVVTQTFRKINGVWKETSNSSRANRTELSRLDQAFNNTLRGATRLQKGLDKFDDWRPRLVPPFVALIPVIAGVLALINPLIAGLGGVGAAAIGFASSLGRVAVGAIGAIPALVTLISLVAALKTSFGGIGNAFKAFGAMQKASGGGGGGGAATQKEELTRTEKLQRAQESLARSIQDVQFAQEDLDGARKDYIKRLRELQKAVDRAALSEARAAANSQLARENYMNVMADPGSTKGEKMDAQTSVGEAQNSYQDTLDQSKQDAEDLNKMKQDGIDGDRQVVMATRRVTDAINAQRDAQIALANSLKDTNAAGGGGASAADAYAEALNKLSPSARRFVEELVAMKGAWDAVKKDVQESFFSEFVGDIQLLRKLLPSVRSLLSDTAGAAGRVADNFLKLITSPKWQSDLILIGKQNVPIIENIGDALLSWVDAFKDLSIVAGPFLTELTVGLKAGAKNFQELVASARADGSLASYLEEVRQRMSQWWRIIKNIGKSLFNYSAAAGSFGTWLTDGFENLTKSWVKSSEEARKAGSPFQKYLEDIKPMLTEVRGLFGDFFRWFAKTSADPKNIGGFTDIVKTIRDDLGPALGNLLQTLADSGIGEKLVKSVSSIVESLDSILKSGGAEGFQAFFDVITNFFAGLAKALENPVFGPVLKEVLKGLGGLAALSFIGKFTGITSLFGWILRLAKNGAVGRFLEKLPGIGALATSTGKHVAGGSGGTGVVATAGGAIKSGASKAIAFLTGLGGKVTASTGAKAGKGFSLIGSISKGAGRGAGLGAIASIVGTVGGDLISSGAPKGKKGSGQRVGGNALAGASSGAGIGALVGSVVPGLGTGIGAAIGGVVGGGIGLFTSEAKDRDAFFEDTMNMFKDFFTKNLPDFINTVGDGIWKGLQSIGDWFASTWESAVKWFQDLPYNIGVAVGFIWGELENFGDWLVGVWNGAVTWFQNLPQLIADTAGNIWQFIMGLGPWLAGVWQGFVVWLQGLPAQIAAIAGNIWKFIQGLGPWLASVWQGFVTWIQGLPQQIATAAGNIWRSIQGVGSWLSGIWSDIYNWAISIPRKIGDAIGNVFRFVTGNFSAGVDAGKKAAGRHYGGPIRRAGGGGVPGSGNSDTVSAMLTPGEFVVRKAIVNRVGEDNLARFNSGVLSYAEMLQRAMANQPRNSKSEKKNSGGGDISFFDGGGIVPTLPPNFGGGSTPPRDPAGSGGMGGEGGFYVENLIVNNPVPETTSESLPRTIRKLAYVGGSRGGRK